MTDLTAARTLADAADKADKLERGDRLLEEVFELLQSGDYPRERVAALEAYVWAREIGEPAQEVGGVMITLAAYCLAHGLDMHEAGETELARIWTKVEKIRAKQAAKPKGSALPQVVREQPPEVQALVEAAVKRALEKAADECERLRNSYRRSVDLYDETDQQRRVVKYSGAAAAVCSENIRAIAANPAEVRRIAEGRDE